jgi:hypothetical protein
MFGSAGMDLPIEIVEQAHNAPTFDVLVARLRLRAHAYLYGEHVLSQRIAFDVVGHKRPRVSAVEFLFLEHARLLPRGALGVLFEMQYRRPTIKVGPT